MSGVSPDAIGSGGCQSTLVRTPAPLLAKEPHGPKHGGRSSPHSRPASCSLHVCSVYRTSSDKFGGDSSQGGNNSPAHPSFLVHFSISWEELETVRLSVCKDAMHKQDLAGFDQ